MSIDCKTFESGHVLDSYAPPYAPPHVPPHAPRSEAFVMQRHKPEIMPKTHTHDHVEILLPVGCEITYQTQTELCVAPAGRLCVLWGQVPHRVTEVIGDGEVMIANLPLGELLSWSMPEVFLAPLFSGQLIIAEGIEPLDEGQFARWHRDYRADDRVLIDIARMELQLRLRRQSLVGWHSSITGSGLTSSGGRAALRCQTMIRYIAENYRHPVSIGDIAAAAGVSKGHAMGLFRKALKTSINAYLTELRLHHAKTMLVNGDEKILSVAMDSGFGSLSQFYEVFTREVGMTPISWRRFFIAKAS